VRVPAIRIIIIMMALAGWIGTHAQVLEIHTPAFANKQVTVTSFRGLDSDTLFSSRLDKDGNAVINMKEDGFILIGLNGKQVYPMIYSMKENQFRLRDNEIPDFTGFPQNSFFLRHLIHRQELLAQSELIKKELITFAADDTLCTALRKKQNSLSNEYQQYDRLYIDSAGFTGAVFISAKNLMESSSGIHTEEELVQKKKEFHQFIHDHYVLISSSDMLQQLAGQCMMMNEYVIVGKKKMETQVEKDICDWIQLLKGHIGKNDIVHYFLRYFISRYMVTMTGFIYEKFPDLSTCPVQHEEITAGTLHKSQAIKRIDASTLDKIITPGEIRKSVWIVMDVACPASIAGQVLLNRFIAEQKIPVSVITVFCGRRPGQGDYHMLPDVKKTIFLPEGISGIGDSDVRIEKYPAFIMINSTKQVENIEYSLAGIRKLLMKLKTAE